MSNEKPSNWLDRTQAGIGKVANYLTEHPIRGLTASAATGIAFYATAFPVDSGGLGFPGSTAISAFFITQAACIGVAMIGLERHSKRVSSGEQSFRGLMHTGWATDRPLPELDRAVSASISAIAGDPVSWKAFASKVEKAAPEVRTLVNKHIASMGIDPSQGLTSKDLQSQLKTEVMTQHAQVNQTLSGSAMSQQSTPDWVNRIKGNLDQLQASLCDIYTKKHERDDDDHTGPYPS